MNQAPFRYGGKALFPSLHNQFVLKIDPLK